MRLEGSCQCGEVGFTVRSDTPYPFMYCYCSICRKTAGGPYGCNIMGKRDSLKVTGRKHLKRYHAIIRNPGKRAERSPGERWFCRECGTHLYVLDDRWPDGIWPNAGAIDTPLPVPPDFVHLLLAYKPAWVQVTGRGPRFREFPKLSIAEWHEQHGLDGKKRKLRAGSRAKHRAKAG